MKLNSLLFAGFLKCPTKCYLHSTGQTGSGNAYADWVREQNDAYRAEAGKQLTTGLPETDLVVAPPAAGNLKAATWRLALDLPIQAGERESRLQAVERVPSEGRGKPAQFIPIRFNFFNKLTKDDRLLVAFDALALSDALGRQVSIGKIIHGDDHASLTVKIPGLISEARKLTVKMTSVLATGSPPDLVLNRHCGECEFRQPCRQKAAEKDDLSILGGMSAKERQELRNKGIFTVTQLSYTFRPRRRPKGLRDKPERYHHSLKALAIREKKIHIVGSPKFKIEGTPVYLDVESLPDRDFYYLIGMRIGNGDSAIQHSFWADDNDQEKRIWAEFITIISEVQNPMLIHYGSYETAFLRQMSERYGGPHQESGPAKAIKSAVNLLSVIFAQVYFPTFSNGLKDIAGYLGFRWPHSTASGLHTIAWRNEWDATRVPSIKQALLMYNAGDCEAVQLLADKLVKLHHASPRTSEDDVIQVDHLQDEHPYGFKTITFYLSEMDAINKAAYWDYQRERILLRSGERVRRIVRKCRASEKKPLRPNKIIECLPPTVCARCASTSIVKHGPAQKLVCDVRFFRYGIKRWVVRYQGHRYRCDDCEAVMGLKGPWTGSKFGHQVLAYSVYQSIDLRIPLDVVNRSLNRVLRLNLGLNSVRGFKSKAADYYKGTYDALLAKICSGRLIHADETKIGLVGEDGFVWVLTNMEEVAFFYTETREGNRLHTLLKDFTGVLVSDFYAVYDGVNCPQQKCLIHLLRDLNDAILKCPYDTEAKRLVKAFALLVRPMVTTVDRYGLKRHFLRKHLVSVDRFYKSLSQDDLQSEAARGFKERFDKNRDKLFTFLNYDGVPWNNNNAEHAIKPFAKLRRIIDGHVSQRSIGDYLVLFSVSQTCKYSGVDFLDFLRSGEKDIDAFSQRRHKG